MKKIILLICSITVYCFLAGCDGEVQKNHTTGSLEKDSTIKIGLIAPLSGPDKTWGEKGLAGIKTANKLDPVLRNGGAIELIIEDDQNLPQLTHKAFIKLVTEDNVAAILVMSNSECVLNLVEIADEYATPVLAVISTHPGVTELNDYISQLLFDDHFQASVAALYVMDELLVDRVCVLLDEENPHSYYLAQEFITKFKSIGGTVVEIDMERDEEKLADTLQFLKEHQNSNFLYTPLEDDLVLGVARTLSKIDWHPVMLGSDGLQANILLQHSDDIGLVNGMLATDPYGPFGSMTEYGKKISQLFAETYEKGGTLFAGLGAEGMSLLISAINRCPGNSDKACINKSLRSTRDFSGIYSKIDIRHNGKAERAIFINAIDGIHMRGKVKVY